VVVLPDAGRLGLSAPPAGVAVDPWTKVAAIAAVVAAVVGAIAFLWTLFSNRAARRREDRRDALQSRVAERQEEMAGDIARLAELTSESAAEARTRVPAPTVQFLVEDQTSERVTWRRPTAKRFVEVEEIVRAATSQALSTMPTPRRRNPYEIDFGLGPSDWELDRFRGEVEAYADDMRAQLAALQAHYEEIVNFCGYGSGSKTPDATRSTARDFGSSFQTA
jgi:hypothetical protein